MNKIAFTKSAVVAVKVIGVIVPIVIVGAVLHNRWEEIVTLLGEAVLGAILLFGIVRFGIFWSNWVDRRKWAKNMKPIDSAKVTDDEKMSGSALMGRQKEPEPRETSDTCEGFDYSLEEKKEHEERIREYKESKTKKSHYKREALIEKILNASERKP